jgi:hypothetical protein
VIEAPEVAMPIELKDVEGKMPVCRTQEKMIREKE